MNVRSARLAVAGLLALSTIAAHAATTTTVTDLPIDRGGTVRIAHTRPDSPKANIVWATGGNGVINIMPDGMGDNPNFLYNPPYRTRQLFVDRGYAVFLVDAAEVEKPNGITWNFRATSTHLSEWRAVLSHVRSRDDIPTWVIGFSAGSISGVNMALNLTAATPFGLILESPSTYDAWNSPAQTMVLDMNLEGLKRATLVINQAEDVCPGSPPANGNIILQRLTSAAVRERMAFTGGQGDQRPIECDSLGHHGLGGQDAEFVSRVVEWTTKYASYANDPNYTALWWNPEESGWGINLNHQGDVVFATLFTYDSAGAPMWLVMSAGLEQADGRTFTGDLYRTTGPAFNANPFTPITSANLTRVGAMSVTFTGAASATLTYSVDGVTVNKVIEPQVFGTRAARCTGTPYPRSATTNYQDLWWNAAESGWGVNLAHQDDILFATLFTYDPSGKGLWLVMSAGFRQPDGSYLGDLFRTTGPAFNAVPFTPIVAANLTKVGTMQFRFSDGEHGTLEYTYNGVAVAKAITRQVFRDQAPMCN
jgi:hypothetical protein